MKRNGRRNRRHALPASRLRGRSTPTMVDQPLRGDLLPCDERERGDPCLHLTHGPLERVKLVAVCSLDSCGGNEAPVDSLRRSQEDRAFLCRGVANRDDVILGQSKTFRDGALRSAGRSHRNRPCRREQVFGRCTTRCSPAQANRTAMTRLRRNASASAFRLPDASPMPARRFADERMLPRRRRPVRRLRPPARDGFSPIVPQLCRRPSPAEPKQE
jgi:hypothetical protein